jgi:hypothetical protein
MIHAPGVEGVGSSSIMRLYEPRKAEEIARHCGVSKGMVHQVICTYNRFGVEAIEMLAWSPDGKYIASANASPPPSFTVPITIQVWSAE